jgi:glycosidase
MPEVHDRAAATGRREATGRQTGAEQGRAEASGLHNGHSRRGDARRRAAGSVPAVRLEHHVERVKRRAPARPPESNGTRNGAAGSAPVINDLWYKNSVIYCLSVGTFMDSNGDGIGDFEGLMRRLDYLQGLGITAIWLMPFQTSPGEDDGYDVSDYYGVNPAYGTLGDFVEFTHAAQQRGIRVIIDLVVNHTSDQHPWFQQARRDPASKHRDWYVWSEKKPPNANEGMVFPGVQKSTWSYDSEARAWYFHRFYDFQPDLNTSNPHVQAEILKIMGFWIQLGVSGFRMDAVPFVINTKGPHVKKPMEQYDLLRTLRAFLQWRVGDSIILAEANVLPDTDLEYFGKDGDRMHMMFNFQVDQNLFYALAASDRRPLARALKATMRRPETAQWCLFLRNHDELDLGRLTDEQRQRVFQCFGPEETMQLNWTERIIRMRKEVPEVGWGDFKVLPVRDPAILVMRYDWRNNSTLFVHNLSDSPREVSFDSGIPGPEGRTLANVLSEHHSFAAEDGRHRLLLEAYGYRWFRVGGLDYLLKRSDIETPPRG